MNLFFFLICINFSNPFSGDRVAKAMGLTACDASEIQISLKLTGTDNARNLTSIIGRWR